MNSSKRAWDFLPEEERATAVNRIIGYFATERNETIGAVAAENVLDFFLQNAGNSVYNRAIDDMKSFLAQEFEDTILNLDISLRRHDDLK